MHSRQRRLIMEEVLKEGFTWYVELCRAYGYNASTPVIVAEVLFGALWLRVRHVKAKKLLQ